MSIAKKINESPSIDIGTDTQLLAIGADGKVGKGTLAEAGWQPSHYSQINTTDSGSWYRIADINRSCVGIVAINEYWHTSRPCPLLLAVAADCFGGGACRQDIKVLAGSSNRIPKMRIVVDEFNTEWSAHLDMLVKGNSAYGQRGTTVAISGLKLRATAITEAPDVSGANYVNEITLADSGGVKSCTMIGPYLITFTEKGGRHEHSESADRRCDIQSAAIGKADDCAGWQCGESGESGYDTAIRRSVRYGSTWNKACRDNGVGMHVSDSDWERLHPSPDMLRVEQYSDAVRPHDGAGRSVEQMVSRDSRNSAVLVVNTRKEVVAA